MTELITEFFSYSFIIRAVAVGGLVSLCAALLGVILVLKRYSMIGDGLSHVGFGALAVAAVLNLAPLPVSVIVVVTAAFLLLRLSEKSGLRGDALTALVSSSAIAIGITAASLTTGLNTDVYNYMFGSIFAMSNADVMISAVLSAAVVLLFAIFYNKIFAITFDGDFALATGIKISFYNSLTAVLTAITVVIGMRIMGTLLISSLIIFPALTSMRLFKSFKAVTVSSAFVSVICFFIGIFLSYALNIPAGASVVLVNLSAFIIFSAVSKVKKRA